MIASSEEDEINRALVRLAVPVFAEPKIGVRGSLPCKTKFVCRRDDAKF
jgi:hypothetical protein